MQRIQIDSEESDMAGKVLIDRVAALEAASTGSRVATIILGMLCAWLCRATVYHDWIFGWQIVQTGFNVFSILLTRRGCRIRLNADNVTNRLHSSTMIPTINGLLWGVGVNLMWVPGNFEMQLMVLFFVLGIASGSLHTLKPHLPALFLFFVPCMGSILIATLWHEDQFTPVVLLGTVTYLAWSCSQAVSSHKELVKGLLEHRKVGELVMKLEKQKEIAEVATAAKSRFLAAASHDMRQPMHALNLYLGALNNFDLPAPSRPVLAKVRECAQTMDDMFAALLDISRLDASVLQPNINVFPIASVLNKIRLEFALQAQAKQLVLRVAPCSVMVISDAELLENILRNLVSNAVRYTREGKILIGCRRTASGIRVGVYDNGIGIKTDQQAEIFEEFFQVGNRERDRSQGLGLGLAIAWRQAQLIRAPLVLRSEIGRGSVFELELARSALLPALLREAIGQTADAKDLTGQFIVIVDDEAMILDAARLLLEQWGCVVISASSGSEILQLLVNSMRVPDAIICDHRLRDAETGVQVIGAIRAEFNSDIPAVLITGDTSPEQIKLIASARLPVLHKPLQSQILREMLIDLVGKNEAEQA